MKKIFLLTNMPEGYVDSRQYGKHKSAIQQAARKGTISACWYVVDDKVKRGVIFVKSTEADAYHELIKVKHKKILFDVTEQSAQDCSPDKIFKDIILVLEIINTKLDRQELAIQSLLDDLK